MHNQDLQLLDAVEDNVFACWEAPQTRNKIMVSAASQVWVAGQEMKALRQVVDEAVGFFDTPTLRGDVVPNIV